MTRLSADFVFSFLKLVARAELIAAQEAGIQERQGGQSNQISPAQLARALSQAGVSPPQSMIPNYLFIFICFNINCNEKDE